MSTAVRPASLLNRSLAEADPEIARIVAAETARQNEGIELIASENFTSRAVMEAVGSTLTNKYAEGYPGKRYYGGCVHVDEAESLAIARAKALFSPGDPGRDPRERPAARGLAGEHGRLHRVPQARRHDPRDVARARRAPDARPPALDLRQALPRRLVRRVQGDRDDRLGRVRRDGRGREAEAHHRGGVGLPAHARLPALPRRSPIPSARSSWSTWRTSRASWPRACTRRRSATRTSSRRRRTRRCAGRARASSSASPSGRRRSTRPSSRASRAGRSSTSSPARPWRSRRPRRRSSRPTSGRSSRTRRSSRRAVASRRLPARVGRHGQPPLPRGRRKEEPDGQGRREGARRRRDHREQERDPVRPEPADGDVGPPDRDPRRHDARHGRGGDEDDRAASSPRSSPRPKTPPSRRASRRRSAT